MKIYKMPLYYEVAFGFVDVKKQLALFEEFIERKSKIEVKRFLDIGCGPSRQLRELAKRGHRRRVRCEQAHAQLASTASSHSQLLHVQLSRV